MALPMTNHDQKIQEMAPKLARRIEVVRTRFVTTRNDVGFARKKAQTISFIERGFERLGLGHKIVVFRGVHT